MKKRILFDISAHGYGHISQSAPVVEALFERRQLDVTIRSAAPRSILESRIGCPFELVQASVDFGMLMENAVDVDVPSTAASYRSFHENWNDRLCMEAEWLRSSGFDLVVSNVPYLPLKGASLAGIPSVAFCSLNWADLYRHYCSGFPESGAVHDRILDAYQSATAFLRVDPGMPMNDLDARKIGPIAVAGNDRREEIRGLLGLKRDEKIGLVSMGGMPYAIPFGAWPAIEGMHWLIREDAGRADMTPFDSLGMPFRDLLASCDVLVTKPGYGSFVEAALSGVAVLYLSRGDWPEAPYLAEWLERNGRCLEVGRRALEAGNLAESLNDLLGMPFRQKPAATGIDEAADFLESLLT